MFLKFQCPEDGWLVFDKIESLNYRLKALNISSSTEIDVSYQDSEVIVIAPELLSTNHAERNAAVAVAQFQHRQRHHVVAFSLRAFLCNDQGDTVEKLAPVTYRS